MQPEDQTDSVPAGLQGLRQLDLKTMPGERKRDPIQNVPLH